MKRTDSSRWPAYYGEGNRIGILLLHGLATAPDRFDSLRTALIEAHYNVESPLLSGHGKRPEALEGVTHLDWIADVERAYQRLNQYSTHIFIVGVSLGAALALHLAQRQHNIAGLVLANPLISLPSIEDTYYALMATQERYLSRIEPLTPYEEGKIYYPYYPVSICREIVDLSALITPNLAEINALLLLFSSNGDTVTASKQVSNEILAAVRSRAKFLYTLYGASYHQTFDQDDQRIMNNCTLKFIQNYLEANRIHPYSLSQRQLIARAKMLEKQPNE